MRKYDVRYIIVGQQERGQYPGPGLEKFEAADGVLWREVYRDGETVIYQVIRGSPMIDRILWYLVATLLGWLAFPLAYRLLPALPDRGYCGQPDPGFADLGVLVLAAGFLGDIAFNDGGLAVFRWASLDFVALGIAGISSGELLAWLSSQRRIVLAIEVLFLLAFAAWAFVRAANPEAVGTEKPMELAFINAILHSPTFPPHDPWLSGYAISYYYFGYVIIAMLAKLTGTAGGIAFNLGISLIFALSACGAFGLVYNLLNALRRDRAHPSARIDAMHRPAFLTASLLGPLYVLIVSNLEGFLHVLHTRGFFWTRERAVR